jgi:uncharacterized protein
VTKKTSKRTKHIPQRTCVGCRQSLPKRELIRLVRSADGVVVVDSTGKMNGRGVYLHNQYSCWEHGLKGSLANALRMEISAENMKKLKLIMEKMPNETSVESILPPVNNG